MQNESILNGLLHGALTLLKGLLVPFTAGLILYSISYPLSLYSCKAYAESTEHQYRFKWFDCYILTDEGKWRSKQEYQASEVGMKILVQPVIKL